MEISAGFYLRDKLKHPSFSIKLIKQKTLRERLLETGTWEEYSHQRNHYMKKLHTKYTLNDVSKVSSISFSLCMVFSSTLLTKSTNF